MSEKKVDLMKQWLSFGEYEKADDIANEILDIDFQNAYAWYIKGEVATQLKDINKALKFYKQALECNKTDDEKIKIEVSESLKTISKLYILSIEKSLLGNVGFNLNKNKDDFITNIRNINDRITEICLVGGLLPDDVLQHIPEWIFCSVYATYETLIKRAKKDGRLIAVGGNYDSLKKSLHTLINIGEIVAAKEFCKDKKIKYYKSLIDWTDQLIALSGAVPVISYGKIRYNKTFFNTDKKYLKEIRDTFVLTLENYDYDLAKKYRKKYNRLIKVCLICLSILFVFVVFASLLYGTINIGKKEDVYEEKKYVKTDKQEKFDNDELELDVSYINPECKNEFSNYLKTTEHIYEDYIYVEENEMMGVDFYVYKSRKDGTYISVQQTAPYSIYWSDSMASEAILVWENGEAISNDQKSKRNLAKTIEYLGVEEKYKAVIQESEGMYSYVWRDLGPLQSDCENIEYLEDIYNQYYQVKTVGQQMYAFVEDKEIEYYLNELGIEIIDNRWRWAKVRQGIIYIDDYVDISDSGL